MPHAKHVDFELLPVTLIIAAYNEESILPQKIKNTLEIDYPSHLLRVIFITDGSTDDSADLLSQYEFITLLHQTGRKGKPAAIKRAMRFVQTPIVVFSDANSMLNRSCLKAIVRHYADEKVGGVAGEKKILRNRSASIVGQAEGLYWRYESFMKQQDSHFNTVVGAAGELFSIRTELFRSLEDHLILDDFVISMQVCVDGYKIKYEPNAYAIEAPSASLADEEKRKIRIAAGAYQFIDYSWQDLNILKYPLLSIQYFSRRLLRWIACPVLIAFIFLSNLWLVTHEQGMIFTSLLLIQIIFYALAFLGRFFIAAGWRIGVFNVPFYFMFMNLCMVKGFFCYIQGRQTVLWEKSMREAVK
ncbi:MAG TPA: glycosyltransferase family 2 protein [Chitinophagaceae bacterium]|nr:glycosyltransferase family 2 protein [Chitinophagaceae bacterium]